MTLFIRKWLQDVRMTDFVHGGGKDIPLFLLYFLARVYIIIVFFPIFVTTSNTNSNTHFYMFAKTKLDYSRPQMRLLELFPEGVLCESGSSSDAGLEGLIEYPAYEWIL